MRSAAGRVFERWAFAFLALAVLAGAWLRGILAGQPWSLGTNFVFDRHAHSHIAFFGWVTMALFALIADSLPRVERLERQLLVLAHALGVASLAAFVSFMHGGYDAASIVVSVVHVALWVWFVVLVRPLLAGVAQPARSFHRAALLMLMLAGASTLGPGIALARHVTDPWMREFTVKLFLAIFVGGWMSLGVMGAVYPLLDSARFATAARRLVMIGAVPAALMHVAAAPPASWLPWIGRAGTLVTGIGTTLFAVDVLRSEWETPLVRVAGVAALGEGVLQLLAGAGVGATLIASPPIVIAYLHLVLLGVVTPSLLGTLRPRLRAPGATALLAAGGGLMILSVAALGWPMLSSALAGTGLGPARLLNLALAGGALAAAVLVTLSARSIASRSRQ